MPERSSIMTVKTKTTAHRYHIPRSYYQPAMYALKLFRSGKSFNRSVDIASASYQNINRNNLAKHLIKWITNDYWNQKSVFSHKGRNQKSVFCEKGKRGVESVKNSLRFYAPVYGYISTPNSF